LGLVKTYHDIDQARLLLKQRRGGCDHSELYHEYFDTERSAPENYVQHFFLSETGSPFSESVD
jgi:hypothetical protein